MQERSAKEDHTKEKENVLNFSTEEKKEDTLQFQIDYSEHDVISPYDKEKGDFTVRKMSFAVANKNNIGAKRSNKSREDCTCKRTCVVQRRLWHKI